MLKKKVPVMSWLNTDLEKLYQDAKKRGAETEKRYKEISKTIKEFKKSNLQFRKSQKKIHKSLERSMDKLEKAFAKKGVKISVVYCEYCGKAVEKMELDKWNCCDDCRSIRKPCYVCGKPAKNPCNKCDNIVCSKHRVKDTRYCKDCYSKLDECHIDDCNNRSMYQCDYCENTTCYKHRDEWDCCNECREERKICEICGDVLTTRICPNFQCNRYVCTNCVMHCRWCNDEMCNLCRCFECCSGGCDSSYND